MATWMRLEPREVSTIETDSLDLVAYGLWMWMSWKSWDGGGIPDDPQMIRRALRGRIDGAAFDEAWRQVRPLLDVDADGKLRVPWIERAREETITMLDGTAARQREHRKRQKGQKAVPAPLEAVRDCDVTSRHCDVTLRHVKSQDGRTDGRTDMTDKTDKTQKRAPRAAAPPPWVSILEADYPDIREEWAAACDAWATARRENKHKPLGPTGWRNILREWIPRGLQPFQAAVAHSGASGWQSINPQPGRAAMAPGLIQSGPNRGQPSARAMLLHPDPQHEIRETTATVTANQDPQPEVREMTARPAA